MKRLFLLLSVLSSATSAYAGRAVMEGIAASNNTIYIDTAATRVGIGTTSTSSGFHLTVSSGVKNVNGCYHFSDNTYQCTAASTSGVGSASISTRSYSGDQSITATASPGNFVTSSSLTITGLGNNSKVMICVSIPTTAGVLRRVAIDFSIDTDSSKLGGGTFGVCASNSENEDVLSCCTTTNPLSSGSHTFWMYAWTMNGNTYTINKGNPPMSISIVEMK